MVSNPIQRKQTNALLIGLLVGLIVGLLICAVVYLFFLKPYMDTGASRDQAVTVAVLTNSLKSGAEITQADVETRTVNSENAPTDATINVIGSIAKIDLTAGTVLSSSMITTQNETLTNDLREQEYNMISLPTDLVAGDYIDIRLQLPDGGDYIVVSKKYVQKANATTVWLKMNEEETLSMSNAIVEYYIMTGSKLYATTYTDPGTQEAATPTYCPNDTVVALINGNPNITSEIANGQGRFTDALKSLRNGRINSSLNRYDSEEQLENLETKIQEEIESLQGSREAYFGALNAAN